MKNLLTTLGILVGSVIAASAFTAQFPITAFDNSQIQGPAGDGLTGATVQMGTFANGFVPDVLGASFTPDDISAIRANFTAFGETTTQTGFNGKSGITGTFSSEGTDLEGEPIYVFASFGEGDEALYGLWRNSGENSTWVGGDNDALTQVNLDPASPDITAFIGNYEFLASEEGGLAGGNFQLAQIPEPSTYLMMLTGVAGLFFFLRRRK